MGPSALGWLLVIITVHSADGFREYEVDRCVFSSPELKDIEFIRSNYYNKLEIARFTSSLGKFVGYTEFGVKQANYWNSDTSYIASEAAQKEAYCLTTVGIDYQVALDKSVAPTVKLHSRTPPAGHHPSMLVCRVYDFYPKTIKVRWLRDGQEVTSDVTTTDEMEDGDWYYQVHSTLEYTPRWVRTRTSRTRTIRTRTTGTTRSTLRWSTRPGGSEPEPVEPLEPEPLVLPGPLYAGVHAQVWRADLLQGGTRQPEGASGHRLGTVHAGLRQEQTGHRSFRTDPGSDPVSGWIHLLQEEGQRSHSGSDQLSPMEVLVPPASC